MMIASQIRYGITVSKKYFLNAFIAPLVPQVGVNTSASLPDVRVV